MTTETAEPTRNFITEIIDADLAPGGRFAGSQISTRFPPEPNGYMHLGHALTVVLNASLAADYDGTFLLRFDDTNPVKEEQEFVDSITADVAWLGFPWSGEVRFASDYFQKMHDLAVMLIDKGLAYVDDQTAEQIRATRGDLKTPGTPSPFRDRAVEENRELFAEMVEGKHPDASKVLRAKIDMAAGNLNLRDPVMYRVLHAHHHRAGDKWAVYPMYDWAHGLEDSIEGITHSICTLEFEDHRPLYNWYLDQLPVHHPRQIEYARYNFSYIITSKRKLKQLVDDNHVSGWDDPRMPTVAGLRRRGVTPKAITNLQRSIGATKHNSLHDLVLLENAIRADLNKRAPRRMAVLDPLKVTIENWPEGEVDQLSAINNPEDDAAGSRTVPFSKTIYIERDDFMEDAPKKFFRLAPGREVRLRYAYWITCTDVIKDADGNITELKATYDPQTRGGDAPPPNAEGKVRKVKGTLHWVSADHALDAEVRLLDRMFTEAQPDKAPKDAPADWSFLSNLNPDSLKTITRAKLEPALTDTAQDAKLWGDAIARYQFERLGYFCVDADSAPGKPVFNRTVTLKDSWAKLARK